jgi:proline iminopeptidase
MKKKTLILSALLLPLSILLFKAFYPKNYGQEPLPNADNLKYWTLPTGSKIAYTLLIAKGEKKPFPIVYLHGGPGGFISDRTIASLKPLSEDGYDVYLYDQIGSGHSDRLVNIEEYTVERHLKDLEAIVKEIGAPKVVLIGQSWGALLATLFVSDNSEKVGKLILTGAGPIYPISSAFANIKPPDSLHIREPLVTNKQGNDKVNHLRNKTVALWAKIFGKKLASDTEADGFFTAQTQETNKSMVCDTAKAPKAQGGGGYYAQLMTMRSVLELKDPRPKLNNSKIPLFLLRGQCDNQKWGAMAEYLTLFPRHRLVVVPDAGHAIAVEQAAIYEATLLDFLKN